MLEHGTLSSASRLWPTAWRTCACATCASATVWSTSASSAMATRSRSTSCAAPASWTSTPGSDASRSAVSQTLGELLRDAAARLTDSGSGTPRLDAEVLLGHVLHVDRATLLAGPEAGV